MTSRREYGKKILHYLEEHDSCPTSQLIKELDVPEQEKRTFYRAAEDLKAYHLVEGDAVLHRPGMNEFDEIKVTVGPKQMRITAPIRKEVAKKILKKRPFIRQAMLFRKGFAYEILADLGLIEDKE